MDSFSIFKLVCKFWYKVADGVLYQLAERLDRGVGTSEKETIGLLTLNCAQCDNSLNKDQNGPVLIGLRDTW